MALRAEERPSGFKRTTPGRLDEWEGPYSSLTEAQNTVPDAFKLGQTVLIVVGSDVDEYWWKGGITISHLVLKNQGGGGGGEVTPPATSTVLGKIALTGDLGGTADNPTVPGLQQRVPEAGFDERVQDIIANALVQGTNITLQYNDLTGKITITSTATSTGGTGIQKLTTTVTQTSHGFSVGTILRRATSSYAKAQANNEVSALTLGIVTSVIDSNNFEMATLSGSFITLSGLSSSSIYYLSQTVAGTYTNEKPTTGVVRILFQAISSTQAIWINELLATVTASGGTPPTVESTVPLTDAQYAAGIASEEAPFTDVQYATAFPTEEAPMTDAQYVASL